MVTMRIAISAASGLIGSALAADLEADSATVVRLVRRPARSSAGISWNPQAAEDGLDPAALRGVDAVVHRPERRSRQGEPDPVHQGDRIGHGRG